MSIIYPVRFHNNTCVHCGKTGTLRLKDKFGNITKSPVYTVNNLVCINCEREFFIKWEKESDEKMKPTSCSDSLISDFEKEIIEYSLSNKRRLD